MNKDKVAGRPAAPQPAVEPVETWGEEDARRLLRYPEARKLVSVLQDEIERCTEQLIGLTGPAFDGGPSPVAMRETGIFTRGKLETLRWLHAQLSDPPAVGGPS